MKIYAVKVRQDDGHTCQTFCVLCVAFVKLRFSIPRGLNCEFEIRDCFKLVARPTSSPRPISSIPLEEMAVGVAPWAHLSHMQLQLSWNRPM